MKQHIFQTIAFVIVVLVSCETNKPKKPEHLIPKEKMILVLQDIAIANAAKSIDKKKLEEHNILPVEFVYNKHQIDSAQFAESNTYYTNDVKAYKKMYLKVEQNLKEWHKKYKDEEKQELKKDSIKKAKKKDSLKKLELSPKKAS